MNSNRKTARIVGALYLILIFAAIAGFFLIEAGLSAPDFLSDVDATKTQVVSGVSLELINGIAVIGVAVLMFPLLRKENEALALGYVAFRILEVVIVVAAVISPLALIAVGQEYAKAGAPDASSFQSLSISFLAVREILVGQLTGIFYSLAALPFYYLLYRTRLVPRFISIWGLIAVPMVFTGNVLGLFDISFDAGIVFALAIGLNELFLGIWLIARGFDSSAIASESA